jgi:hypothetical protein
VCNGGLTLLNGLVRSGLERVFVPATVAPHPERRRAEMWLPSGGFGHDRADKPAQLLATRQGVAADPHAKNVFEKNRMAFFLRITEDEGTGMMVITYRLATLPLALFDEGDDELLVGVCDCGL